MREKKRLLVVEDERIVAVSLTKALERLGYEVVDMVATGEEAVQKAIESSPDLILMDISLQGPMDGIEASQTIHSRSKIPIIFLSAHSDKKLRERAKAIEPSGYIIKPFSERLLDLAIQKVFSEKDLQNG